MTLALGSDRLGGGAFVPMNPVVRLVVLPIEALTEQGDHFRCVPYSATLRAGVCVERQRLARSSISPMKQGDGIRHGPRTEYHACRDCQTGQEIARRIGTVSYVTRRGGAGRVTAGRGISTAETALQEAGKCLKTVDPSLERRWRRWMASDRSKSKTRKLIVELATAMRVVAHLVGTSAGGARHVERCLELLLAIYAA